jgi:hypothetical protein
VASGFHDRTMLMLGRAGDDAWSPPSRLLEWGRERGMVLPGSFVEWAARGGDTIAERHNPGDNFWFGGDEQWLEEPAIHTTPEGFRGICFHRESQGNYDKIVLLNHGDDPPVLFGWCGNAPWIVHSLRFSDCLLAHVFDYQYAYDWRLGSDGTEQQERYSGSVPLRDPCLHVLRSRFEETVTTWGVDDDWPFAQYRFLKSSSERMTVVVGGSPYRGDAAAVIMVTGATDGLAMALEAELFEELADHVVPLTFSSLRLALHDVDRHLRSGMITQLRRSCVHAPDEDAMAALMAAGREQPFAERHPRHEFPAESAEFAVGAAAAWGVTIQFRRKDQTWWWLDGIVAGPTR